MDSALVVLVIIVVLVAIDAIGRLDERRERAALKDPAASHKMLVDLTRRDDE